MSTATKIHFYSTRSDFEGDPSEITSFETTPIWHRPNGHQPSNIPSNKKKNHKKRCKYLLWFFGLFILCIIIGGIGLCFYFEIFNFKKYNTDTSSIENTTQTIQYIPQTQKPQVPVQPLPQTQKPYVYERPVPQTQKPYVYDQNISKDFKITDYHKINLNNVYISLAHQTGCIHHKNYQCWSSKLEFKDEIVENVHVQVDGIVNSKCKVLLNKQCTEHQGVRCFKMSCDITKYLYFYTHYKNSQGWMLPKGDVFFLLEKGNYHSAWQAAPSYLSDINRENIRLAHLEIRKFNYFEHYPMDQLLLVFTQIFEKSINNAVWYPEQHVYVKKLDLYIPIHARIDTGPNKDEGIQLHERIHEYINGITTGKHHMIRHLDKFVYIGNKTVNLVLEDSQYDHTLSKQLVFLPKMQRYGLLMQDNGHLGNWGKESAPSNYGYQSVFRLGKYTMSVINEAGYYMT